MNINEFIQSIPEELYGNLSYQDGKVIFTQPDGKGVTVLELGAEGDYRDSQGNLVKAREVLNYDSKQFEGLKLREVDPIERVEEVQEATAADISAALTDLNDRLDCLETGKSIESAKQVSLWGRIKAVFTG